MFKGEIKEGDFLIWDFAVIGGSERVVVKQVVYDSEGCSIFLSGIHGDFWTTEDRVREMFVRRG